MNPIFVKIREDRVEKYPERYRISTTRDGRQWVSTELLSEDDLRIVRTTIRQFLRELKHRRNQK